MVAYRIGFIMEQALGHITHTNNLQQNVTYDPDIQALWGLIPFDARGLAAHIPVYKSNWTVRAGLQARRHIGHMLRQAPPEAFFFHTQVPAVLATDWIHRIPSIVSLDATPIQYDSLGEFYSHGKGPLWLEQLKWRLNRECYRAARHIVTWSQWAADGLIKDYDVPAEKITVIPPGVNIHDWANPQQRQNRPGPVKVLFVGGNLERKGGLILLEAFRALRDEGMELHLVTRDNVEPEPGLFVYNAMQPNSPELKQLYHQSDVFCLPTFGDCLPMVLSEAGAAGMPVVSTRVAAIPEIVHDGETGFLVPTGNAAELTAALRTLIKRPDLRMQQGERARQVVTRNYDAPANTRRLLELLKREVDATRLSLKVA